MQKDILAVLKHAENADQEFVQEVLPVEGQVVNASVVLPVEGLVGYAQAVLPEEAQPGANSPHQMALILRGKLEEAILASRRNGSACGSPPRFS